MYYYTTVQYLVLLLIPLIWKFVDSKVYYILTQTRTKKCAPVLEYERWITVRMIAVHCSRSQYEFSVSSSMHKTSTA